MDENAMFNVSGSVRKITSSTTTTTTMSNVSSESQLPPPPPPNPQTTVTTTTKTSSNTPTIQAGTTHIGTSYLPTADALAMAARDGLINEMQRLLDLGIPINDIVPGGGTSLTQAAAAGQIDAVSFLLERGADVNAVTAGGVSVVAVAAEKGFEKLTRKLVESGADVSLVDRVCIYNRYCINSSLNFIYIYIYIFSLLFLQHGRNALHACAIVGNEKCMNVLLSAPGSGRGSKALEAVDVDGNTPLLLAARYGHASIVKALIKVRANLKTVNKAGHTAVDAARVANHRSRETEDALIDAEIDLMG
jgi:Ankyrin repeats (3 copies)/Ankyrin repeat